VTATRDIEPEITLSYQLPRDVLVRTLWLRMLRTRRIALIAIVFLLVAIGTIVTGGASWYLGYFALAYLVFMPFSLWRSIARAIDNNPHQTDRKTATFTSRRIIISGTDWRTELPWSAFNGFSEDSRFLYFHTPPAGWASLVPKSALSADQQEALRDLARANVT